jgi:MFS family permease
MAGVVVDRVNRRRLMIAAALLRGVVVLGLVLIRRPDQVWIAYVVTAVMVSASAFFEPARTATIPNITSADELLPANALSSALWSGMLAIGASVGGLAAVVAGRNAAFVLNAVSFFASAIFIARTRYDATPASASRARGFMALSGLADPVEASGMLAYARGRADVREIRLGGLAGSLLLPDIGQRVFPIGGNSAAGIGLLYGARGVGAALGPIVLRWMLGQTPAALRRTLGPAYFIVGGFYIALAFAPTLWIAALAVLCAHFGGSILWVFSTVLLQLEVPDRFRGRVFAAELALVTISSSASSYWTGYQLDRAGWSPRSLSLALGVMFMVPGAIWLLILSRWRSAGTPDVEV